MNERIKELVKQAGGHISIRNLMSNPVQHRESIELWDDRIEKFAELLIQQCVNAIVNDSRLSDVRTARTGCVRAIKEHFGVEE